MFRVLLALALVIAPALHAEAQSTTAPTAQPTPRPPDAQGQQPRPATSAPEGPRAPLNATNVQIEITISDQAGTAPAMKKTVTMLVASGYMGRIRASANARPREKQPGHDPGFVGTGLNVDARPRLYENDRILLELTIEYSPLILGMGLEKVEQSPTELNESIHVVLTSGKPMVISQAADPVTDRRMTVEVRATIMR